MNVWIKEVPIRFVLCHVLLIDSLVAYQAYSLPHLGRYH